MTISLITIILWNVKITDKNFTFACLLLNTQYYVISKYKMILIGVVYVIYINIIVYLFGDCVVMLLCQTLVGQHFGHNQCHLATVIVWLIKSWYISIFVVVTHQWIIVKFWWLHTQLWYKNVHILPWLLYVHWILQWVSL